MVDVSPIIADLAKVSLAAEKVCLVPSISYP